MVKSVCWAVSSVALHHEESKHVRQSRPLHQLAMLSEAALEQSDHQSSGLAPTARQ